MQALAVSLLLGLVTGSFLGCCIYRLPRNLSLWNPPRSFCPSCRMTLPWWQNLPVISWLLLQGRCGNCRARISVVYPLVELATAILFVAATWRFGFPAAFAIWVFGSLLIVATVVDFEFLIIPDITSKGGIVAGLVLSGLVPALQGTSSVSESIARSAFGFLVGTLLLWLARWFGQIAFGRYRLKFKPPAPFQFTSGTTDDPALQIENDSIRLREYLLRTKDRIRIEALIVRRNGEPIPHRDLRFFRDRVQLSSSFIPLAEVGDLRGELIMAEFPREAMGLGDLKLIGAIGAFTGWAGVLFTIPFASFLGLFYAVLVLLAGKRRHFSQIPFGPFMAAAALTWMFAGREIWLWYLALFR